MNQCPIKVTFWDAIAKEFGQLALKNKDYTKYKIINCNLSTEPNNDESSYNLGDIDLVVHVSNEKYNNKIISHGKVNLIKFNSKNEIRYHEILNFKGKVIAFNKEYQIVELLTQMDNAFMGKISKRV